MNKLFERIYRLNEAEQLMLEHPAVQIFKQQIDLISDPDKKIKVINLLRKSIVKNVSGETSSTGKYHPKFAHGNYGLSRHVKAVISFAADICTVFGLDKDTMIIAAMMHDIMKYKEENSQWTSKDHAGDASKLLKDAGLIEEARLVNTHMGQWSGEKQQPKELDEKLLHLADYLASKQWISVDFDKNDNIIENNNLAGAQIDLEKAENDRDKLQYENDYLMGKGPGF